MKIVRGKTKMLAIAKEFSLDRENGIFVEDGIHTPLYYTCFEKIASLGYDRREALEVLSDYLNSLPLCAREIEYKDMLASLDREIEHRIAQLPIVPFVPIKETIIEVLSSWQEEYNYQERGRSGSGIHWATSVIKLYSNGIIRKDIVYGDTPAVANAQRIFKNHRLVDRLILPLTHKFLGEENARKILQTLRQEDLSLAVWHYDTYSVLFIIKEDIML